MADLADELARVIHANGERINRAASAYPGEPIQVVLDWQPAVRTVRLSVRPTDNAPPFRVDAA